MASPFHSAVCPAPISHMTQRDYTALSAYQLKEIVQKHVHEFSHLPLNHEARLAKDEMARRGQVAANERKAEQQRARAMQCSLAGDVLSPLNEGKEQGRLLKAFEIERRDLEAAIATLEKRHKGDLEQERANEFATIEALVSDPDARVSHSKAASNAPRYLAALSLKREALAACERRIEATKQRIAEAGASVSRAIEARERMRLLDLQRDMLTAVARIEAARRARNVDPDSVAGLFGDLCSYKLYEAQVVVSFAVDPTQRFDYCEAFNSLLAEHTRDPKAEPAFATPEPTQELESEPEAELAREPEAAE